MAEPGASVRLVGESGAMVTLRDVVDEDGHGTVHFVVDLESGDLRAASPVRTYESATDGLAAFLESLADRWRGWAGTQAWDSHGTLRVEARHDGRRVGLRFVLRERRDADAWTASVEVTLAPGEDLATAATDVTSLLRSPPQP